MTPSNPSLASTLLLLRDGTEGVEVFMERRHTGSNFVGCSFCRDEGGGDGSRSMRSAQVTSDAVLGNVKPSLGLPRGHDVGTLNHQVRPVE